MSNQNVLPLFREMAVHLIGNSPAMACVKDLIEKYAPANSTVLILGPSGTGKELVAKSINYRSSQSKGPFIAVNCGALPETLIESELFGAKKGAFTGAVAPRIGYFEAANGGTIFLDEIGELPPAAQVKLLRVLQEGVIQRLGESHARPIDCRVIAATSKDLKTACRNGTFRQDLYYRLAVATIHLPPLSERTEDIPLLVNHFLEKLPSQIFEPGRPAPLVSDEAMDVIMRYPFPGNVRELENAIERAIIHSDGKLICVEDLPEDVRGVKEDLSPPDPHCAPSSPLLEALTVLWPRPIRLVKAEDIARFLTETHGGEFSRKEFEVFLRRRGRHGMNKSAYATAGRYLRDLIEKGILEHNGGKANKSRFRVSEDTLMEG